MSSEGELGHPLLHLTAEEKRVFGQLFQQADTERLGVVTGEIAVKFFEKTKVAPPVLGEIWQIADTENRGLLTKPGFSVALRLIGHYQAGREPTPELAFKPGPLPKFEGMTFAPASPPISTTPTGPIQPQTTGPIRVPPLTPDKITQYSGLFERSGAQNGILPGDSAKAIFERAGLPNEVLGRIWTLADREQKGALGMTEFIIAMHLITSYKSKTLTALPSILPAGLYEAAARRGAAAPARQGSISSPAIASIPRQFTGPQRTQSPLGRAAYSTPPPQSAQLTGNNWLITPQEKAKYDIFFTQIDTARSGFLTGDQAVKFFSDSGLSEEGLASIWDLADIKSEGQLNQDEFAVAMYLIRQQRSSAAPLPAFLPAALIPPSMRNQSQPPAQPTAPVFNNAANSSQLPKSASEDLFGLDAATTPPVAAQGQVLQQTTGSSAAIAATRGPFDVDPFGGSKPSSPVSPQQQAFQVPQQAGFSTFKPFAPTSAFGATLHSQNTGGSVASSQGRARSQQRQIQPPSAMDDLLGDNDEEQSRKLTEETTELANMSTQVGNLRNQMQDVQTKRSTNERDVSTTNNQKRELETRLQQFRAQYAQEVQTVKSLETQLVASRESTKKLQQEFAMLEGTRQDLQGQHQQIAQALDADQRENATLKERIVQLNTDVAQLKPQIEKMRSDARQQKGMVAINKKQLATNEGERDRIQSEMTDLKAAEEDRVRALKLEEEDRARRLKTEEEDRARALRVEEEDRTRKLKAEEEERMRKLKADEEERAKAAKFAEEERARAAKLADEQRTRAAVEERTRIAEEQRTRAVEEERASTTRSIPEAASTVVSPGGSTRTNPFFRQGGQTRDVSATSPGVAAPGAMASAPSPSAFDALFGPSWHSAQQGQTAMPPQTTFSGQSVSTEGRPTPSATPPLSTYHELSQAEEVPPPPPESRQFTPAILPMRQPLSRGQSVASSTFVAPPGSMAGFPLSEEPNEEPFSRSVSSPLAGDGTMAGGEEAVVGAAAIGGVGAVTALAVHSHAADERVQDSEPARGSFLPKPADHIPGAFPEEGVSPMPSSSALADDYMSSDKAATGDDFDSAFADFGEQETGTIHPFATADREASQAPKAVSQEFPPIQEFGHEDESDSEDEHGFGNDFGSTPSAPNGAPAVLTEPAATGLRENVSGPSDGVIRPGVATNESAATLPGADAMPSPPSYNQTMSPTDPVGGVPRATSFPPEFTGLLPAREDPTTVAHSVPEGTLHNAAEMSETPGSAFNSSTFEDATAQPISSVTEAFAPAVAGPSVPRSAFDDDFADFDNLDEARADDSAFDFHGDHSEAEFNPTFDSPAASVANTTMASAEQTPVPNRSFASNGFHAFDGQSQQSSAFGQAGGVQTPQATSHDWDAIFSGLDAPPSGTESSFGGAGSSFPEPAREVNTPKAVSPVQNRLAAPHLSRAMTTEHDDPILKRLTAMGYDRGQALGALEKFDYDINQAADYLTSK